MDQTGKERKLDWNNKRLVIYIQDLLKLLLMMNIILIS